MGDLHARADALADLFFREVEVRCPGVTLADPRDPNQRGSHIAFRFEHADACMQAQIERGVIGDFRAPGIMRFGITALFIDDADIRNAVDVHQDILKTQSRKEDRFQTRAAVT